ncbi:MAG: hypothetical protein EXS37_16060 [Opitutus sp.]|nr:hypothetical protein [Opitutus sp.]
MITRLLALAFLLVAVRLPAADLPGLKVGDTAADFTLKDATGRAAGVPHPVVFILDQKGVVRAKLARDIYRERPESAEIIAAVKSLK